MKYPIIDKSTSDELVAQLLEGEHPSAEARSSWVGTGEEVELGGLDDALKPLQDDLDAIVAGDRDEDREVFEGRLSAVVHAHLAGVPVHVLDDPGFWRYLTLTRFWWYVRWREAKPLRAGNARTYTDGEQPVMAIPSRLFLRGQAVERDGDYAPAYALERSADFWRSHVLRVKVGSAPALTRAFVRLQQEHQMRTEPQLRPFARQLNRTWTNVLLHLYEEDEALDLLEELYTNMGFESGKGTVGT